ncbi:Pentatricopeptide repeat-containing protein [Acorus calamus]|uniref:Pentatricopeptide repeat-containing protein n=1 Tax=Acorus calamus TaxID=4465 RepID=A0AAV9EX22_ACOCL|nr:Pentatricopeptide repeat-containing protein [Acorus calamus]
MLPRSIPPNHLTHPLLSKACADLRLVGDGEKSQARTLKSGLGFDRFVRNSLIYMYSNFGRLVCTADVTWILMIGACMKNYLVYEARKAFDRMPRRDRVSWNSMVIVYIAVGELEEAIALFMRMPERDMMSWNPVIDGQVHGPPSTGYSFASAATVDEAACVTNALCLGSSSGETLRLSQRPWRGSRWMRRGEELWRHRIRNGGCGGGGGGGEDVMDDGEAAVQGGDHERAVDLEARGGFIRYRHRPASTASQDGSLNPK